MWSFGSSDDLRTTNRLYDITLKRVPQIGLQQRALTDFMIIEMEQEFSQYI